MSPDPDDYKPDPVSAYQRLHEELHELEAYEPPATDVSREAQAIRLAIADRKRVLRDIGRDLVAGLAARWARTFCRLARAQCT